MDEYVRGAAKLGVRLEGHGRYLFPPCRDGKVCAGPLKSAQLNDDLKYWLTRCQIFDGETVHGMRSGGSIEKSLSGESLHEVEEEDDPRVGGQWRIATLSRRGKRSPAAVRQ